MRTIFKQISHKKIITILGIFLSIISGLQLILSNMNVGGLMVFAACLAIAIWYILPANKIIKALKILFLIGVAAIAALSIFIFAAGESNNAKMDEDAVIVLGCSVHGTKPSVPLQARIEAGAEYAALNPSALIIASGGQGKQEDISEAQAIYNGLVALGVEPSRIILEDASTSTSENFMHTKRLLDEKFPDGCTLAYITNSFHSYRAGRLAALNGLNARAYSAKTSLITIPTCYSREALAVIQLWLFKR